MDIQIDEAEVQELIKKTVVSRVTSHVDKFFNENKGIFHYQTIEGYIREAIERRVWQIGSDKFDEAFKDLNKKEICESLACKIYTQLFENY